MLEAMAAHMAQPERFVFNNLGLTGGLVARNMGRDQLTNSYVRTTTALTMLNAGIKENVVPQRAEAKVNFRLLPGDTAGDGLWERIRRLIDETRTLKSPMKIGITYPRWLITAAVVLPLSPMP